MKIIKKHEYTQDVETIYATYSNKAFIKKKMKALGGRNISVEMIEQTGDTFTIQIIREMAAEVPGPLQKFAKPWNKMTQTEVWKGEKGGPYYGEVEIDIEGVPVIIKGQMKLVATESGSAAANITEFTSTIPFLGKLLTKFAREASEQAIQDEFDYIGKKA